LQKRKSSPEHWKTNYRDHVHARLTILIRNRIYTYLRADGVFEIFEHPITVAAPLDSAVVEFTGRASRTVYRRTRQRSVPLTLARLIRIVSVRYCIPQPFGFVRTSFRVRRIAFRYFAPTVA
jgi:hypothetical protein